MLKQQNPASLERGAWRLRAFVGGTVLRLKGLYLGAASLEVARIEATRKHWCLATFVVPIHPNEAIEPQWLKSVLTVLIASVMSSEIGLLGLGIIREHIGWV
ncbi:hypothetical protein AB6Q85_001801 [Vibrio cholerae]|nr:hypothetical protein [Vibrio cholerae]